MGDLSVLVGKAAAKYLTPLTEQLGQSIGEGLSPLVSELMVEIRPALDDVLEKEIMPKARQYVITGLIGAGAVGAFMALVIKRK